MTVFSHTLSFHLLSTFDSPPSLCSLPRSSILPFPKTMSLTPCIGTVPQFYIQRPRPRYRCVGYPLVIPMERWRNRFPISGRGIRDEMFVIRTCYRRRGRRSKNTSISQQTPRRRWTHRGIQVRWKPIRIYIRTGQGRECWRWRLRGCGDSVTIRVREFDTGRAG